MKQTPSQRTKDYPSVLIPYNGDEEELHKRKKRKINRRERVRETETQRERLSR